MGKRILSLIIVASIVFNSADFSVFAMEKSVEVEETVEEILEKAENEETVEDNDKNDEEQVEEIIDNRIINDNYINNPVKDSKGLVTWSCISFGKYWQNDTNKDGVADQKDSKETIIWRVLDINNNLALVISDKILDGQDYHSDSFATWEKSQMRTWLNNTFYNNAFSDADKDAIIMTSLNNPKNPSTGVDGGNNTKDKIFLLSISEVSNENYGFDNVYTNDSFTRCANVTDYAKRNKVSLSTKENYVNNGMWWLRTPGSNKGLCTTVIGSSGNGSYSGLMNSPVAYGFNEKLGVRPALVVDLNKANWEYVGKITSYFKSGSQEIVPIYPENNGTNIPIFFNNKKISFSLKDKYEPVVSDEVLIQIKSAEDMNVIKKITNRNNICINKENDRFVIDILIDEMFLQNGKSYCICIDSKTFKFRNDNEYVEEIYLEIPDNEWKFSTGNMTEDPLTSVEQYVIDEVIKYTDDATYSQYDAIQNMNLSYDEKFKKYIDLANNNGITDIMEGFKYVTNVGTNVRNYRYVVDNENYCAYSWWYWLNTTVDGKIARGLLYADSLIFNFELDKYLSWDTYLLKKYPGAEKCKTMLKEYMDYSSKSEIILNNAIKIQNMMSEYLSINGIATDSEIEELMEKVLNASTEDELQKYQSQFADFLFDRIKNNVIITNKEEVVLYSNADAIAAALKKSTPLIKFAASTAQDIVDMINLENEIRKYQEYEYFLKTIFENEYISFEMRIAAYQLYDTIHDGYYNEIISILLNVVKCEEGYIFFDKSLLHEYLESQGMSAVNSGLLGSALSTIKLATVISNIVIDTGDFVKQAAYTMSYAELSTAFSIILEEDKRNFRNSQTIENAWKFYDDYNLLWRLRYLGEKSYLDMNTVKAFIFGKIKVRDYSYREDIVKNIQKNLEKCRFYIEDTGEISIRSDKYISKMVISCPVDVLIYDNKGNLIAKLEDEVLSDVVNDYGRFAVVYDLYTKEYIKVLCQSTNDDINVEIIAMQNGLVNFQHINKDSTGVMDFDGVMLNKGDIIKIIDDYYQIIHEDGTKEDKRELNKVGAEYVKPSSIELKDMNLELAVGEQKAIAVSVLPHNSQNKSLSWYSEDESVAKIKNGVISAEGLGETIIWVKACDSEELRESIAVRVSSKKSEQYTVMFISESETETDSQIVQEGEKAIEPKKPNRNGYNFVGWYMDDLLYDFETPVTANILLRAKWIEQEMVSVPIADIDSGMIVKKGTEIKLICKSDALIYYTLDGTEPNETSILYDVPIEIAEDTVIKAIAVKEGYKNSDVATFSYTVYDEYKVIFKTNCEEEIESQIIQEGEKATEPQQPAKEGYRFTGWYLDGVLYDFDEVVTSDIVLYAIWTEKGKAATPTPNVASGTEIRKGSSIELVAEEGAKIYYTLDKTEPDEKGIVYETPIEITEDTVIKAIAVKEGYKNSEVATFSYTVYDGFRVTFKTNCEEEIEPQIIHENEKATKPTDPTKEGYNFTGWYLEGVLYDFDTPVTSDITLEAGWTEQGTVTAPSANISSRTAVTSGTEIALTSEADAKIYYTIDGTDPTVDSLIYDKPIIIKSDTTIKAFASKVGMKNSDVVTFTYILFVGYTVKFNSNGGTEVKEQLVEKDGKAEEPVKPVKEGFVFAGWYLNGVQFDFNTAITTDIVLEAKWTENIPNLEPKDPIGDVLTEDIPDTGIPDGLWVATIKPVEYTGKALEPEVHVYDGSRRLKEKTDYTITYKNNTKANDASNEKTAPTVIVSGKGNYAGKETAVFEIVPVDLNSINIDADDISLAFNSKRQTPIPTVTWNNKKLKNNTDYTVSYPDEAKNGAYGECGKYDICINGTGNFKGKRIVKLVITKSTLISKASIKKISDQRYMNGAAIEPVISISYKGRTLIRGTDYTVAFKNNKEIGTAKVIITGINSFGGTRSINFKIAGNKISARDISVTGINNTVYTGKPNTQKVNIVGKYGILLKEGKDFKVSYVNNTNAGTAKMIITGINGYSGSAHKDFKITAVDISTVSGIDTKISVKYAKGGVRPEPVLSFNGTKLKAGVDFYVSYKNNKAVTNNAVMVIKGKGNYKGTVSKSFSIIGKQLDDKQNPVAISASDIAFVNKAGKYISKPVLKDTDGIVLKAGTDYEKNVAYMLEDGTVLDNKSIVNADTTVKVIVSGKGAYEGGQLDTTYRVTKSDFTKAKITIEPQTYSGEPIYLDQKSFSKVKIGNTDITSNYGIDYEIVEGSYKNNISKGTASVTIRGKGNYGGSKNVNFKIKSKGFKWWWRDK